MDKRVVFAVAGSGKTSSIIDRIGNDSRCLIVTYTDNNTRHLKIKLFKNLKKYLKVFGSTVILPFCIHFALGRYVDTKLKLKGSTLIIPCHNMLKELVKTPEDTISTIRVDSILIALQSC